MTRGIEDPKDYYYRRLYVDAHHAVEAAAALEQVGRDASDRATKTCMILAFLSVVLPSRTRQHPQL
jgi:hypothetical protein